MNNASKILLIAYFFALFSLIISQGFFIFIISFSLMVISWVCCYRFNVLENKGFMD